MLPVINDAASLAKNTTAPTSSSAVPYLPMGVWFKICAPLAVDSPVFSSINRNLFWFPIKNHGAIALTLMFFDTLRLIYVASHSVKFNTDALAAL